MPLKWPECRANCTSNLGFRCQQNSVFIELSLAEY